MDALPNLEVVGDHASIRPSGHFTVELAITMLASAIVSARDRRIPKLLIDVTAIQGLPPLSVSERYLLGQEAAKAGAGAVRVAIVARLEMIDPQKFGVLVARNRGLDSNVFTTNEEALAWLDHRHEEFPPAKQDHVPPPDKAAGA